DPAGRLLAPPEAKQAFPRTSGWGSLLDRAQQGEVAWQVAPQGTNSDVVLDVLVPVTSAEGRRLGYVRLLRRLPDVAEGLHQVRRLLLGTLAIGLVLSGGIGWVLAQSLSRPLQQVTRAIAEAPLEGPAVPLPESGPQEIQQLIRTYNRLQTRRVQLEEARRLLVKSIVHEFGRLIGALRAAVHALQGGAAEDPGLRQELLQGMSQTTGVLTRLLEDLTQIYRHMTGPLSLQREPLELGLWLQERAAIWAEIARERALRWKAEIPPDLPVIQADPARLAQALENLVDNAFKFTPAGGCVTLRADIRNREVRIQVQDTGPGIPPEELPRLFEP
ncbi:MAG: sensor histidine kinase, partial [Thermoflexus sp.]